MSSDSVHAGSRLGPQSVSHLPPQRALKIQKTNSLHCFAHKKLKWQEMQLSSMYVHRTITVYL